MQRQRRDGALAEARIHAEGHVRRRDELVDDGGEHEGQALTAELRIAGEPDPAGGGIIGIGLLEPRRRFDAAVLRSAAALDVADPVERRQHLLGKPGAFAKHGGHGLRRRLGEARQVGMTRIAEHVVKKKKRVVDGSLIIRHR